MYVTEFLSNEQRQRQKEEQMRKRSNYKQFYNVYVRGVPYTWNEEKLKQWFGQAGPINKVATIYFPETGRINYAFVCYQDSNSAEMAKAKFDGIKVEGKKMVVRSCREGNKEAIVEAKSLIESAYDCITTQDQTHQTPRKKKKKARTPKLPNNQKDNTDPE